MRGWVYGKGKETLESSVKFLKSKTLVDLARPRRELKLMPARFLILRETQTLFSVTFDNNTLDALQGLKGLEKKI